MIINKGTNSDAGFRIWISKLELRDLFIYDGLTNKADLIKMTQIQTRTHMHQISEMLAIVRDYLITDSYSRWLRGTCYQTRIFTSKYR